MDKVKELNLGDKILGASGILLLLFSFFTWFKKDYDAGIVSGTYNGHNGWGGVFSLLGILLAVALVVLLVLRVFTDTKLPENLGGMAWPQVTLIAGIASFALVLLQVIIGQSIAGQSLDRSIWAFLALLAAAGVAAGAYLGSQEDKKGNTAPPAPPAV